MSELKKCKKCKKEKDIKQFRTNHKTDDKKTANCIDCIESSPSFKKNAIITQEKQELFLSNFYKSACNVAVSCKAIGVSRETYYNWLNDYDSFKKKVEEEKEGLLDFVEGKLMSRIQKDDTTAIIFHLKTKGKERGYTEKIELDHSGELNRDVVVSFKGTSLEEIGWIEPDL
jgi:hypothetical protein